jgi:2-methylcitrate dehydratase PrpD
VRRGSRLPHFRPGQIAAEPVQQMLTRVRAVADPALDARGHTAVDLVIETTDGRRHGRSLDVAPGYPGSELSEAQHRARFDDCMSYAARPLPAAQSQAFVEGVEALASLDDARRLLDALIAP